MDAMSARAMDALRRLVSALRTSGVAASGDMRMSVAQLFAFRVIGGHPGMSMGDLAAATLTTPSAVSEVVSRLVGRGLVRREPDATDHRRVLLQLTWEGERLFVQVEQTLPERLVASLAAMDPEARRTLADALENWVAGAGLSGVTPNMLGEGNADRGAPRPVERDDVGNVARPVTGTDAALSPGSESRVSSRG